MWQKPFILHCLRISSCDTVCYEADYSKSPFIVLHIEENINYYSYLKFNAYENIKK